MLGKRDRAQLFEQRDDPCDIGDAGLFAWSSKNIEQALTACVIERTLGECVGHQDRWLPFANVAADLAPPPFAAGEIQDVIPHLEGGTEFISDAPK